MTGSLLRKDAVDLDLILTIGQVRFNPIQYGSIDSGSLQLGEQEPMVDGVECLCEVEVDQVHRVSFIQQAGDTFFLKDKVG